MPTFNKISHVSFSARDAEESARFWRDVFGFEDLERIKADGWQAVVLLHPPTGTIVEYQQHDENAGEEFDPRRTGFDHMGLQVLSRAELDEWQARFAELGVPYTPVVDREYGSVLTFKDPDRIQFEMFYRADHP